MKVYIVDVEPIPTRYTEQWKTCLPKQMQAAGLQVQVIEGPKHISTSTTPGMFLNFSATNIYKSVQAQKIASFFADHHINPGDYFLFTDAWNPSIIQLKYMSSLLGVPVKIGGLWHAGSYDPYDGLGQKLGAASWVRHVEKSFFHAIDHNFFATDFHIDMFKENLFDGALPESDEAKLVRVGWPMEYLNKELSIFHNSNKKNLVLFPHRITSEKQPEIFYSLKERLPQYEFVVCQERALSKVEYHALLSQAKVIFSANLQETLGISWYEGAMLGAIPMVPDRLSYKEMALDMFKYPSEWTEDFESYKTHLNQLADKLIDYVENYSRYMDSLRYQVQVLQNDYFSGNRLYSTILQTN